MRVFGLSSGRACISLYIYSTSNYIQSLSQGLDAIRSNAGWLSRDGADVRQWLVEHKYL